MEDMRHEVAEIEEDPAGLLASFAPEPLVACLEELLLDLIGDGGDIALAAPGDDEEDVDEVAAKGEAAGCLGMPARQMPDPIGYICMLKDPDGNMIEFSYDQGVYETARDKWS